MILQATYRCIFHTYEDIIKLLIFSNYYLQTNMAILKWMKIEMFE